MYTAKQLQKAAEIIKRIAREDHLPEAQIRAEMKEAIRAAKNNPDPAARALWASFRYRGAEPTAEEFILWSAGLVKEKLCSPVPHPRTNREHRPGRSFLPFS